MTKIFKSPRSEKNVKLARITRKLTKIHPLTTPSLLYSFSEKYCNTNGISKTQFYGVLSQSWSHKLIDITR